MKPAGSLGVESLVNTMVMKAVGAAMKALQFEEGVIESYDARSGTVRVALGASKLVSQPMPYVQPWAGPNQTGMGAGPLKGNAVLVLSIDLAGRHMFCFPGTWNDKNPPMNVPAGEAWIVQEKDATYAKLKNDGVHQVAGKTRVENVAPIVCFLSSPGSSLSDGNAVVRKSDLQAVVNHLNNVWRPQLLGNPYLLFGMPVVPNPTLLIGFAPVPTVTASSVARAE